MNINLNIKIDLIEAFYSQRKGTMVVWIRGIDWFLSIDDDDVTRVAYVDATSVQGDVPVQASVPAQAIAPVKADVLAQVVVPHRADIPPRANVPPQAYAPAWEDYEAVAKYTWSATACGSARLAKKPWCSLTTELAKDLLSTQRALEAAWVPTDVTEPLVTTQAVVSEVAPTVSIVAVVTVTGEE